MSKSNNNNNNNNIEDPNKLIIHKCRDWPSLAEEHNWDTEENEYFRDGMFVNILQRSKEYDEDPYNADYDSSLQFFSSVKIKKHRSVYLVNAPGCLMCHSDFIEDKVHYALIKGLCDIKTVQYYLFSKGIFFKAWYIKDHLKHVSVIDQKQLDNQLNKDINVLKILDNQITNLQEDIKKEQMLEKKGNGAAVSSMRRLLKEYLDLRSQFKTDDDNNNNNNNRKEISFDEIMMKFRDNK